MGGVWFWVGLDFGRTTVQSREHIGRSDQRSLEVRWELGEDDLPAMISPTIFLSTPLSSIPRFNNS